MPYFRHCTSRKLRFATETMIGRGIWMARLIARFAPRASILAALLTSLAPSARAQTPQPAAATQVQTQAPAATVEDKSSTLSTHQTELKGIEDTIEASEAQRREIEAEIENLRGDRARLAAALIATTQQVSTAETKISEAEARLETLNGREEAIRRSLESRRTVIAEVLASLQRMGRTPPPALLVAPEDMLKAIRTSMLLGAVLPEMRAETEALATDLADLIQLRQSIAAEKAGLAQQAADLGKQRQKLAALIDVRQAALGVAEAALAAEQRSRRRSRQPSFELEAAHRPDGETSWKAPSAQRSRRAKLMRRAKPRRRKPAMQPTNVSPFKDPGRLAPAMAFADDERFVADAGLRHDRQVLRLAGRLWRDRKGPPRRDTAARNRRRTL